MSAESEKRTFDNRTDAEHHFEHRDGVWRAIWHTPNGRRLSLLVIGDLMGSQDAPSQLQTMKESLDERIDKASCFASQSAYRDDIHLANGIVVDSVVVSKWGDLNIWFTLGQSGRMLAVRMHEGMPVDVYCDHP
jgi:hypothetical protein